MALIWTEEDNNRLAAMKILTEKKGPCLIFPEGATDMFLSFDVLDYFKANSFIMDIFNPCDTSKNHEDITGIRVTSVGRSKNDENIRQALEHLSRARELLEQ